MKTEETALPGVLLLRPDVFQDNRGSFVETWREQRYTSLGLPSRFVQDNAAISRRGVLRGLHYQYPHPQGKLITVLEGEIWDVAVDIRRGSPSFGRWTGETLSAQNAHQLWIPEGFAHGYVVLSDRVLVIYKCTRPYVPESDGAIRWDDSDLGIDWPVAEPQLSPKDAVAPRLAELAADRLPPFTGP